MSDYILRVIDNNSEIRAFVAIMTDTCQRAQKIHALSPVVSSDMNKLLITAAIMQLMEKNDDALISLQLSSRENKVNLNAVAIADGYLKCSAIVEIMNEKNMQSELKEGFLKLVRDIGMREPYISTVQVKDNNLGQAVQDYYAQSEQVESYVIFSDNNDEYMGLIVQLLPNAKAETIENLKKQFAELDWQNISALGAILEKLSLKIVDKQMVKYKCNCSREQMGKALISLGKEQLQSLIDDGEPLEMGCRFCKKTYTFTIADLHDLVV